MSASPFTTIEEFNNVLDGPTEGAIYTFAHSPAINTIALLASVGIFVWFIVATYRTHASPTSAMDKSLNKLSSFIVVSLLSVVAANQYASRPSVDGLAAQAKPAALTVYQQASRQIPLGLLGIVSAGLPGLRKRSSQKSRKKRGSSLSHKYKPRR